MKSQASPTAAPVRPGVTPLAAILALIVSPSVQAANISWNAGTGLAGSFTTGSNWVGGVVPGAADVAKIDNGGITLGASTVTIAAGDVIAVTTVDLCATNVNNNRPVISQSGGTLTTGTLLLGHAAYGGTKSPEYQLSGGTLGITTAWSFGDGTAIKFTATGGTVNYSGGAFIFGNNGVNHPITLSNNAAVNYTSSSQITFGGGTAAGSATLSMAGTSSFTANTVGTILMGNDGTRGNSITLADSATFSASAATFAMGQWNNGSATVPATAAGTITLGGTSYFNVGNLKTGGNNALNPQWGVVNLNGGTLEANTVQIGSSNAGADATHNVVNANGGIVKAKVASTNFFNGVFLNLLAGGLTFDTNGKAVTIVNPMTGAGGLTKKGAGTLTLSNSTLTYAGATVINEGTLALPSATFPDTASVTIASGGKISLGSGLEDQVGSLTINGVAMPDGVYGSSASGAPLANQSDVYFAGTGTLRVGAPTAAPRALVWEGFTTQQWVTGDAATGFLVDGVRTGFHLFDNVTFADGPDATQRTVALTGTLQPGSITVNNSAGNDYSLTGTGVIGGSTGVVKQGAGKLTLGGTGNTYSGAVNVNAGTVVMGSDTAFGLSSGITIAAGGQVDISGRGPGAIYTYTIAGTGPNATAAIVNGGAMRQGDAGIKNLILTADASIGNTGNRFDIGQGGTVTGNSHTLTKVGTNDMGFRGDASGSPINIVAAGGTIWAETSTGAYGGAGGTLRVKSGARAGTYGALGIATPVTIESGGMLHNQGGGAGTWSGAFSLAGEVAIDSTGGTIALSGAVSGTANVTKSGANNVTVTNPVWAGNTTVTAGPLTLATTGLSDTGRVTLNGATSTLSLTHGTADTVGTLFLDGVQQAAGTYVSTTNTQNIPGAIATAHIVGATGSLVVTTGPVVPPFDTWANARITNPAYANLKGRLDDPDGDGINNVTEFLFGSDPQAAGEPLVGMVQAGSVMVIYWNEHGTGEVYVLQETGTLAGNSWAASAVVPVVSGDQSGVPANYVRKEAMVPVDSGRKFLRVRASEN
ncbi:autotransporter-associated beta strand repeat-containing protein [Luteolibacter sp. LG18]|uniref:beta strand repeat-containing protein n=1 Tax=Luteolibacter sp. LG18 TaxID=2819286 RepID=UPI002B3257B6|nr:hypothetical protein llg_26350 [Luteolibacter sp. LG18]